MTPNATGAPSSTAVPLGATPTELPSTVEKLDALRQVIGSTAESVVGSSSTASASAGSAPYAKMNVAELSKSLQHFGVLDYFVFILMLVVCAAIGFYFGFIEKRQKKRNSEERRGSEALDYLVGGRKMKVIPVALSLVASFISGISLLGTSTEIYVYGTQYAFILITLAVAAIISWYIFLPVFCNLQLTSTYEYLELRFDHKVRVMGSVLFTIGTIIWLPIVIYIPALSLNQVTGVNVHIVTPVVCVVCIFYTCVGGVKAVVWTDVIQTGIMVGAIIFVSIKGTANIGGLGVVLQRNYDSNRLVFPTLTMDPTERLSAFAVFGGSMVYYVYMVAANQVISQRFFSLPSQDKVKQALVLFVLGSLLIIGICAYNGLLIYATYHDCDPLSTGLAKSGDQLMPLLVQNVLGEYPGMTGVFIAGVFSAALSSLSTGLNSLAAVILEDYVKPLRKTPLTERQTAILMRGSVVGLGALCVILVFVVERLGTVIQMSMTLSSIIIGPLCGSFIIGFLLPWINAKSTLTGGTIAFFIMAWISINAQLIIASGDMVYEKKSVSTTGCTYDFEPKVSLANATLSIDRELTFVDYIIRMSFVLYAGAGSLLTIVFAAIASLHFGFNDPATMNIELFAHCIRKFIKPHEYDSVQLEQPTLLTELEEKTKLSLQ